MKKRSIEAKTLRGVINKIRQDERVDEISDERGSHDGVWVYLKPGWTTDNPGEHAIHGWNESHYIDISPTESMRDEKADDEEIKEHLIAYWPPRPCSCSNCKNG